jgi:hypothetical protein
MAQVPKPPRPRASSVLYKSIKLLFLTEERNTGKWKLRSPFHGPMVMGSPKLTRYREHLKKMELYASREKTP